MKCYKGTWTWIESLGTPKQCKQDIRFETWIVSSLYRSGSLHTAAWKLAKYGFNFVENRRSDGTRAAM